jgi:hypothetical protein
VSYAKQREVNVAKASTSSRGVPAFVIAHEAKQTPSYGALLPELASSLRSTKTDYFQDDAHNPLPIASLFSGNGSIVRM